ncbi:unnamed protein product [Phytomonas sp. EM1]|nr:unnamed protein product [Phytomonas sp. EM1]|eukprot:CCW59652.1 unnamed protein product [Phytomonas sp. isolate EM1]
MIRYLFLMNRQGRLRLAKWYITASRKERAAILRDVTQAALGRSLRMSNVAEVHGNKFICRRYASLYFIAGVDHGDNELITLEIIHHFVEVLDRYFENVCELDLIYNFHRSFFLLDEVILAGELQESSKRSILKYIHTHDTVADESEEGHISTSVGAQIAHIFRNL